MYAAKLDALWRDAMAKWLISLAEQVRVGEAKLAGVDVTTENPEKPGTYAVRITIEAECVGEME